MPDSQTYRLAIAAASRGGWAERERELRQLANSWQVLHGEGGGGGGRRGQ